MSLTILSMIGILLLLPISLLARNFDWNSALCLTRDLSIPMGLLMTLILLGKTLVLMGDPSMLYTLLSESMLPSVFGLMQYTVLKLIPHSESTAHQPWQVRLACVTILSIVFLYAAMEQFLLSLFDIPTMLTISLGTYALHTIQKQYSPTPNVKGGNLALRVALLNGFYRGTQLFLHWEDPTTVGPNITDIILGFVYGYIILMISEVHTVSPQLSSDESPLSPAFIMGSLSLSYLPVILFSLGIDISTMNQQTESLELQSKRQHQLLRDLINQQENEHTGTITVSSDKPAWVFINDQFVSSSPLFKYDLDPGKHTIKIASCPTKSFMNPEDNISWNEYWDQASDGSCREPSESERISLIEQGLAEEVILETTDGYDVVEMQYKSGVNFCCHNSPTKTIEVQMMDTAQMYVWSFVNNEWIQNSSVQN